MLFVVLKVNLEQNCAVERMHVAMLLRRTALVLSLWCQAGGDRGVDTSTWGAAWSESDFVCLKEEGNAFVIIEAFRRSSSVLLSSESASA